MSHDAQFADHPSCPYHVSTRDESAYQAAVDSVADRHFRHTSPEFCEWVAEEFIQPHQIAALLTGLCGEFYQVQQAKGVADSVRDDWREFVANAGDSPWWPMARQIAREVRRES